MKEGNQEACQEVIEGHMRLAFSIAHKFSRFGNREDLEAQAMIGLCQAVKWAGERLYDDNITLYIISNVHRFCHEYYDKQGSVVRVPRRSYKAYIESGGTVPRTSTNHSMAAVGVGHYDHLEAEELFNQIAKTEREKIFLQMILDGHMDKDVAERCKVSKKTISLLRRQIEERARVVLRPCGPRKSQESSDCDRQGSDDCGGVPPAST